MQRGKFEERGICRIEYKAERQTKRRGKDDMSKGDSEQLFHLDKIAKGDCKLATVDVAT